MIMMQNTIGSVAKIFLKLEENTLSTITVYIIISLKYIITHRNIA